jgi:zona occludens toxin
MSIIVYTGVMGSGKTLEAVKTGALNALRIGRRVVTNIRGFNFEAIRDHLGTLADGTVLQPEKVVIVPSKRISEPFFFFDPDVNEDSVVKAGDLVLIDEVWEFWGKGCKLPDEHQKFFRMHRHYSETDTGISCDLLIMIQDLTSLHTSIRGVIQSSFKFTKMNSLGLSSRYRVEVYEGNRQSRATLVSVNNNKYDKKIFPLYKSYEGVGGKEKNVDDRQNLFKNKLFIVVFIAAIVGLIWAGYWFTSWIHRMQNGGKDSKTVASSTAQSTASSQQNQASNSTPAQPQIASDYRLVTVLEGSGAATVLIIQTPDGRYIRKRMDAGLIDGWQTVAGVDGRMVGFSFGTAKK